MKAVKTIFKTLARIITILVVALIAIYLFRAFQSRSLPDLQAWHRASLPPDPLLDNPDPDFEQYLATEQAYLAQIYEDMYEAVPQARNKYNPQHLSSPIREGVNLNGSFQLAPEGEIRGGIVLAHGLTDSPYHLRDVAQVFASEGLAVICLRLPGHGSVPAALTKVQWTDWYQGIEYAVSLMREKIAEKPLYLGGFSTGGALMLHYSLQQALQETDAMPQKLFLFSPAIEIDPLAEVADWHVGLSWLPFWEKFKWSDIEPEYDPFKYNSFPKNAGDQIYDLTVANQKLIKEVSAKYPDRRDLPAIISFQSDADATVHAAGLYELYAAIGSSESELVVFDVNRTSTDYFVPEYRESQLPEIAHQEGFIAKLEVVTNLPHDSGPGQWSEQVTLWQAQRTFKPLPGADTLAWPPYFFALSHVCIPIAPSDPVYGANGFLGNLNAKGEKGVLTFSAANLIRIRYNPFYPIVEQKVREYLP